jgi:short-subunit dehydrogenase
MKDSTKNTLIWLAAGLGGCWAARALLRSSRTIAFKRRVALINNAGVISVAPMEEMTDDDHADSMAIHFWACLHAIEAVLPSMRGRGFGRIVNISSIGGKVSVPHLLPYCASKFALTGLSEGLRAELLEDGIHVTTVIPGLMRTGSPRHAQFKGQHRAEHASFALGNSLPGLSISPERAARQIITAFKRGDAEVTLTLPARVATRFHGLFPGPDGRQTWNRASAPARAGRHRQGTRGGKGRRVVGSAVGGDDADRAGGEAK